MTPELLAAIEEIRGQRERFGDEDLDWTVPELDLTGLDLPQLLAREHEALSVNSALRDYRKQLEEVAALRLGQGGKARLGDTLYRYGPVAPDRTLRADDTIVYLVSVNAPTEPIPEPYLTRAMLWIAGILRDLWAIVPLGNPRVTAIDGLAQRQGIPSKLLRELLIDETEKPDTLTNMPVTNPRAPKYAAKMTDGEIRPGKQAEPAEEEDDEKRHTPEID